MDTLFYVLDKNYKRVGLIDSFVSLMWCKRYYEIGALDLEVEATEKNLQLFKKGFYIIREDDETVFRIEAVEIDTRDDKDNVMTVGAVDVKAILSQRVIADNISYRGYLQDYIFQILDENLINAKVPARRIANFSYERNEAITDTIQQQVSHEIVSNKIIELCRSFLMGWKVTLEDEVFKFSLYRGTDRSDRIVFSPDNDNLLSSKYTQDSTELKNCVLVAGEEANAWVGSAAGLDRFEDFTEESGAKEDLPDIEYLNQLKSKGYEVLAEKGKEITFEGDVIPESYRYKVDFDLGDVVKIRNELGIETNTRITEIIEIWDDDGYTLDVKFEYLEFQGALPPVDLERELIYEGATFDLTYTADECPYGITVELYGEAGTDGQDGKDNWTNEYNFDTRLNNYWSGDGGEGGQHGRDWKVTLNVDGQTFNAVARGGAGGGGGAGGWGTACKVGHTPSCSGGTGGKGANGDVVTIDLVFNEKIDLTGLYDGNYIFKQAGTGEGNILWNSTHTTQKHGGGGYSGIYKSTNIQGSPSGMNGANAPAPTDSSCSYPNAKISNTNDTSFIGFKIYTWKEVPITV